MFNFFNLFKKSRDTQAESAAKAAFQKKFSAFQALLTANNQSLDRIADLEALCYGVKPFTLDEVVELSEMLVSSVYDIADALNAMSKGRFEELFDSVERISNAVFRDLVKKKTIETSSLTMGLFALSLDNLEEVGGKAANLGEVKNRVGLPTPKGFSITAYACRTFLDKSGIVEAAKTIMRGLDVEDTQALHERCAELQERIMAAPLPEELQREILAQVDERERFMGEKLRFAVRSSALSEDSEASFAGQYTTVLNVFREGVIEAFKTVVASSYTPRAVYYRRSKGWTDDAAAMSVFVLAMVDAAAGGVMYTRDPNNPARDFVVINAVPGLGAAVVDGTELVDHFEVSRKDCVKDVVSVAQKYTKLVLSPGQGIVQEVIAPEDRDKPSLTDDQICALAEYGLKLEAHYGRALDVEWAVDKQGKPIILQARPLALETGPTDQAALSREALAEQHPDFPILMYGGQTASRGKAHGPAYILTSDHNLLNIPDGVILIAPQTSPRFVAILGRTRAIVAETGGVTGHMAAVAREFGVPVITGLAHATRLIPPAEEITVDATNTVVFKGVVEAILERVKPVNPMKGSPVYKTAHTALKKIAGLNLIDPNKENFTPAGCLTLHDVIRFAHEMSMREMFSLTEDVAVGESFAVEVRLYLPMRVLAVDLGGGLKPGFAAKYATIEDIDSIPLLSLVQGMKDDGVQWAGPVAVSWSGFASILAEGLINDQSQDERMGGPNYAAVSKNYLNFNSRLGYHFAVVDAYIGDAVNDNYITFSFKGGAADIGRRSRRAVLIAAILKKLGFSTELKNDLVKGVVKKYERPAMEKKMRKIGNLLGAVRLLDMVLSDDQAVGWYVDQFMKGNYTFSRTVESLHGETGERN